MKHGSWYTHFAKVAAHIAGRPASFGFSVLLIVAWLASGPIFHYSDTWQLVINTATTVITFLMVFLIQNTQNRDTEAVQVKLDELLRAHAGAHNALMDLEELEERELDAIRASYVRLAAAARKQLREGGADIDAPELS